MEVEEGQEKRMLNVMKRASIKFLLMKKREKTLRRMRKQQ
jgi:hypothetical protein